MSCKKQKDNKSNFSNLSAFLVLLLCQKHLTPVMVKFIHDELAMAVA